MAITTHKSRIGYEDINWYDAEGSDCFTRKTTTGGPITLHKLFAPGYPCKIGELVTEVIYYALDNESTILHQWGGGYFHLTMGNNSDALGIIFSI